eukprot:764501-Hanusia_phi.AAC.1
MQSVDDGTSTGTETWNTRDFDRWMDQNGITRCVQVEHIVGCGRGLRAVKDLEPNEVVLRIPPTVVMSDQTILRHTVYKDMQESLSWSARLALGLLNEKLIGESSAYCDYLSMLPAPPQVLSRWREEELLELQNKTLEAEADMIYFWRHEKWQETAMAAERVLSLSELARFRERFSQLDFLDAHDVVCSRAIRLGPPRGEERLLVPVFDLANHSPRGGRYAVDEDGSVCLVTGTEVAGGAEVRHDKDAACSRGDGRAGIAGLRGEDERSVPPALWLRPSSEPVGQGHCHAARSGRSLLLSR